MYKKLALLLCVLNIAFLGDLQGSTKLKFTLDDSILKIYEPSSDTLAIAFGGKALQFGIPIFEFKKMLSNFDVNVFLVRDYQQVFYYYGLYPNGNISSALKELEIEIDKLAPKKIVLFGNSAGGYAALLFGFLLLKDGYPISQVHAFAPRNRIEKQFLSYPNLEPQFFNVHDIFLGEDIPPGIFNVYYAMDEQEDVNYAYQRLCFKWITHFQYESGGHFLIQNLKKSGVLFNILDKSLN